MRKVQDGERLQPEEIAALRSRITEGGTGNADDRPMNIHDVAEAFGMSDAEVRSHLERIRAEKAFGAAVSKRRSQKMLVIVAVALLALAAVIYEITPRPMTEEDMQAKLEQLQAKRATMPKKVTYPIITKLELKDNSPPLGFGIQIEGRYTKTIVRPLTDAQPTTVPLATERLIRAMTATFDQAEQLERNAPRPTSPLPKRASWNAIEPGTLRYDVGNTSGVFEIEPRRGQAKAQLIAGRPGWITRTAESIVQSKWTFQQESLAKDAVTLPNGIGIPPCGFGIRVTGRHDWQSQPTPIVLLPVDEAAVRFRLEKAIRDLIRSDQSVAKNLPQGYPDPDKKKAVPPWTSVTVTGPIGPWTFKLPTNTSEQYPTAADAMRATDQILKQNLETAVEQVRRLNMGGK